MRPGLLVCKDSKSRLQLWIWKYWNFGFISQSVDIQYVQRWKNAEFEREIFWKLVCVCFHALWAVCNRQEWCLRQDGGSDGKWQSYGSWCTVSLKGGFKLHKQIRKIFTLHSDTWKCAKSRSTKAEKIIPNKMKGFTCQLIVYNRLHPWGQRKIFLKWKSICIFKCALNKLFNNDFSMYLKSCVDLAPLKELIPH